MSPSARFDVAVIGASVAGASLAHILGAAGLTVLLIDRCEFPRRKPCGEGLSHMGVETLRRIGLWEPAVPPHLSYRGYELTAGGVRRTIDLADPGVTVRRDIFDAMLVDRATAHTTVSARFGSVVRVVDCEGGHLVVGGSRVAARHIVIADGSSSRLAESIGIPAHRSGPKRVGISLHYAGTFQGRADVIRILIENEHEIYCTPISGGQLNVNILARSDSSLNPRSLLLSNRCRDAVFRVCNFEGEAMDQPIGRAAIGNVRRECFKGLALLVGDACEEFDPIGGMGMTHAVTSAELAARAILKMEFGGCSRHTALHEYALSREVIARRFRAFSRLSFSMMRSAARIPGLLNIAASPIGEAVVRRFVS